MFYAIYTGNKNVNMGKCKVQTKTHSVSCIYSTCFGFCFPDGSYVLQMQVTKKKKIEFLEQQVST